MCTPLPVRSPRAAQVLSHELGFLSTSGIHEGIIILSICVRPMDARHEGEVIDQDSTVFSRCSTIQKCAFRAGDMAGEFVQLLVEGEGCGSALGCVVPRDPLD